MVHNLGRTSYTMDIGQPILESIVRPGSTEVIGTLTGSVGERGDRFVVAAGSKSRSQLSSARGVATVTLVGPCLPAATASAPSPSRRPARAACLSLRSGCSHDL
jgi:hypothetical protein